jgi:uncharacterized protein (TIGR00369 family)
MSTPELALDGPAIEAFIAKVFPQALAFGFEIEHVDTEGIRLGLPIRPEFLRPGGTVSGPTLMTLADTAVYLAVLARVGPRALAVTTNLNMNFLRRPEASRLTATCRLLKLGRRLAVGEVHIVGDRDPEPVAQATLTYSIPPEKPA